ncbi:MAG: glycosyltransferase family 4 protein [Candidatus Omnitrophica bacterium]|nr:glycosyltransferase family 4 protein [Candidatus Omnitrophota bacterium]
MNILMISTDEKRANHKGYSDIADKLVFVVSVRGKNEFKREGNIVTQVVGYRNIIGKYIKLIIATSRLIKEEKIDIICVDEPFAGLFVGCLLKMRHKVPLSVFVYATIFENLYDESLKMILLTPVAKYLLSFADSVRAMCPKHKKMLVEKAGLKEERIFVCPPGYKISHFVDNKESARSSYNGFSHVILFVGRFVRQKDLSTLMKSLRYVKSRFNDILCVMIGSGPEVDDILLLAKELGIDTNVKIIDAIPNQDLPKYYAAADLFALSSVRESLGVVIIEAAASNKPVVTTKTVGAEELVIDGQTGYVVDIKDHVAFGERIISLLSDSELAKKMGMMNFEHVSKLGYFTSENNLNKVKDMCERTVACLN